VWVGGVGVFISRYYTTRIGKTEIVWQNSKPDVGCAAKTKNRKPKKKMWPMPSAATDKRSARSEKRNRNAAIKPKTVERRMRHASRPAHVDPRSQRLTNPGPKTPNTESKHHKDCHALGSKTAPKKTCPADKSSQPVSS